MPKPRTALLVTLAVGAVLFLVVSLARGTSLSYTLGVGANAVAVKLEPGKEFCQEPITAQSSRKFDHVEVTLGTYHRPGSPLAVTVLDPQSRRVLARGALAGGFSDITQEPVQRITLDHAINPKTLAVCFRNTGEHSTAFYGSGDGATQPSSATRKGQSLGTDVTLAFTAGHRSWASAIGDVFSRAPLFRTPRIPGWLYLAGLVLLAAGAAAALTAAVGSAFAESTPSDDD
ncbi:hypothetical protein [Baekduia sp. Peel2402]|uniref:hypothetical protein n=1 Tax=Baekduia sp. Peel2402 TaxID=3458296 RepID=UPI00403E4B8B